MAEPNPYIDVLRLIAAGVVGGLIATYSSHLLTVGREKRSGQKTRKREFLAFMKQWRHEIDRWHMVVGGRERKQMAFYDGVSAFCVMAEPIRNDFSGSQKARFVELFDSITYHGKLEYGCKHEDLIKTIDELITIADKN